MVVLAGIYILLPASIRLTLSDSVRNNRGLLLAVGAVCGLGSGLTGAGGPLFSVPLMLLLGFAPLTAIGTGQVLQIASAGAGSIGNLHHGQINFQFALWLTVAELLGVYAGYRLAHRVNAAALRVMVAVLCVSAGAIMLVRLTGK